MPFIRSRAISARRVSHSFTSDGKTWELGKGECMDTRLLTLKQLYDEVVNREILDTRIPVVYDGKDIIITPEIAALFYPDSAGRLQPLMNTSGQVTEANSADILLDTASIETFTRY